MERMNEQAVEDEDCGASLLVLLMAAIANAGKRRRK